MRETFEVGDTVQMTFTCSVAPDAAPYFAVLASSGTTLIQSQTAQQSTTLAYYAMQTMSLTGTYVAEWGATKTVGGTPYPYRKRFTFNVIRTTGGES